MKIVVGLEDQNGNEIVKFPAAIPAAVNEITISNAATGGSPSVSATGDDANIDLNLITKGSGVLKVNGIALSVGTGDMAKSTYDTTNRNSDIFLYADGKKNLHGVESFSAPIFDNTSHTVTIPAITYWYQGVKVVKSTPTTCDIDDYFTLTTNKLYYIAFNDTSGTLKAFSSMNLKTMVPTCMIFWNGSAGALTLEMHGYQADIDWHINAHRTIGTRYYSGLNLLKPTTALDDELSLGVGNLYDEDFLITIPEALTYTPRLWRQVSNGTYTFEDISMPYSGSINAPTYLDTDTYMMTAVGASNFVCYWVYGSNDKDRPIYIIPTQASVSHNTIAIARAEAVPVLTGLVSELAPEWKLLHRLIYKGDGEFQESSDYRQVSSLPSGAIALAQSASAVGFVVSGNIASTNVQSAIEELDSEKVTNSISSGKLLGRATAGTGVIEEITLGTGLTLVGNVLNASGGSDGGGITASDEIPATPLPREADVLAGVTATAEEINVLAGIPTTLSSIEIGYLDGVTADIQTQLNDKADVASPTFSGTTNMDKLNITNRTSIMEILETANLITTAYPTTPTVTNIDLNSGAIFYNTAAASGNIALNIRGDVSFTASSIIGVGKSMTFTVLITQTASPFYINSYTIDGVTITPKWLGSAPTAGNANAIDVYTFTIIKTDATPTYTMLASSSKFI